MRLEIGDAPFKRAHAGQGNERHDWRPDEKADSQGGE
jgi:hypothetical protein